MLLRHGVVLCLAAPCFAGEPAPGRSRIKIRVRYRGEEKPPERFSVAFDDMFGVWRAPNDPTPARNDTGPPSWWFAPDPKLDGTDGKIEAVVPVRGDFCVSSVTADGHEYRFPNLRFDIRDGAEFAIDLDRAKPITLLVVDAKSLEPLPGARVYPQVYGRYGALFGANAFLPSPGRLGPVRVADDRGAVHVDAGSRLLRLYVVADDRAWQAIWVLPTIGGEAVVRLLPGGQARLHVEGWKELRDPTLRAFCDHPPFATHVPQPDANGDLALLGVPAGKVRFQVHYLRSELVYGAAEVEIEAGKVAKLTIPTTSGVRDGAGEIVHGTLRAPATWCWPGGKVNATLRGQGVALLGAFAELAFDVPSGSAAAPFETGPLPPGRYELEVHEFRWRTEVEIRPGEPLDLVVPEPRVASLRFVDSVAGTAIALSSMTCQVADEWNLPDVETTREKGGAHVLRTASERIRVAAQAPGYAYLDTHADLKEGAITFPMHRSGGLRVRLRLGERPFGGDGIGTRIVREGTDEGGPLRYGGRWTPDVASAQICQEVADYEGLQPGRWHLSLTDLAGIEHVRQIVEIRPGETTEVEIDLKRAR